MGNAEEIWRSKADQDLVEAATQLASYTPEGERIIREEMTRRGLAPPPPIVRSLARVRWRLDQDSATVYSDAKPSATIIAEVKRGNEIEIVPEATEGGFVSVELADGRKGYVTADTKGILQTGEDAGLFSDGFLGLLNKGPVGWILFGLLGGVAYGAYQSIQEWLGTP